MFNKNSRFGNYSTTADFEIVRLDFEFDTVKSIVLESDPCKERTINRSVEEFPLPNICKPA